MGVLIRAFKALLRVFFMQYSCVYALAAESKMGWRVSFVRL
jgi:hypothetical protein